MKLKLQKHTINEVPPTDRQNTRAEEEEKVDKQTLDLYSNMF